MDGSVYHSASSLAAVLPGQLPAKRPLSDSPLLVPGVVYPRTRSAEPPVRDHRAPDRPLVTATFRLANCGRLHGGCPRPARAAQVLLRNDSGGQATCGRCGFGSTGAFQRRTHLSRPLSRDPACSAARRAMGGCSLVGGDFSRLPFHCWERRGRGRRHIFAGAAVWGCLRHDSVRSALHRLPQPVQRLPMVDSFEDAGRVGLARLHTAFRSFRFRRRGHWMDDTSFGAKATKAPPRPTKRLAS